jgi:prepilin-type N-terminal cleavage/methylation domain-containing protein
MDMKNDTKKSAQGFTFIEMIIGLVILGVVGVMAIPRYVDAAQQALDDSLWQQSVAVKNAHDQAVSRGGLPSVATLTATLVKSAGHGEAQAVAGGVQVRVDGKSYLVPTYSNPLCTQATSSINDTVRCVGAIAG